jgi:hypothetical protein
MTGAILPSFDERTWAAAQVEKHTLRDGPYKTSEGIQPVYLDAIAMILAEPERWRSYFEARIPLLNGRNGERLWPVARGSGGATVIGLLGCGTLWQPFKDHGLAWNNLAPLLDRSEPHRLDPAGRLRVALIDDCRFTGATLSGLRQAVEALGCVVEAEVTAFPFQPLA